MAKLADLDKVYDTTKKNLDSRNIVEALSNAVNIPKDLKTEWETWVTPQLPGTEFNKGAILFTSKNKGQTATNKKTKKSKKHKKAKINKNTSQPLKYYLSYADILLAACLFNYYKILDQYHNELVYPEDNGKNLFDRILQEHPEILKEYEHVKNGKHKATGEIAKLAKCEEESQDNKNQKSQGENSQKNNDEKAQNEKSKTDETNDEGWKNKRGDNSLLVEKIKQVYSSDNDKFQRLKMCVEDTNRWGNGRTIDRGDFAKSAVYKVAGLEQSASGIHTVFDYFYDNKQLYEDTLAEANRIIDEYNQKKQKEKDQTASEREEDVVGKNLIYYGAPGAGKSYQTKYFIRDNGIKKYDPKEYSSDVFRITLHPEYSYSDFVGQVMPKATTTAKGHTITYEFNRGIFTEALSHAFEVGPKHPVFLVMEEMSRANVAGVFGDLFQLLDRDEKGVSEYRVNNSMIADHLGAGYCEDDIYLPNNLYIIGTVNTSDQNVYPMDTAFKRRFEWHYISTEVSGELDNNPQIKVLFDSEKKLGFVTWQQLFTTLNNFIVSKNGLNLSEDKQIGPYFIKFTKDEINKSKIEAGELKKEFNKLQANSNNNALCITELNKKIKSQSKFESIYNVNKDIKSKLLNYLWDDVQNSSALINNKKLFKDKITSFSKLFDNFDTEPVFSKPFLEQLDSDLESDDHNVQ